MNPTQWIAFASRHRASPETGFRVRTQIFKLFFFEH